MVDLTTSNNEKLIQDAIGLAGQFTDNTQYTKNEKLLRDAIGWVGRLNENTQCTVCALPPPPMSWIPFAIWGTIATLICVTLLINMSWARGWRQPFGRCPQMKMK